MSTTSSKPGVAAVVKGNGIPRIEPDRLSVVGDGVVIVLLGGIGAAAEEDPVSNLGSEPDRLVEVGDGVVIVLLDGIGVAAVVKDNGRLGIEPDRLGVVGDGAVIVLGLSPIASV